MTSAREECLQLSEEDRQTVAKRARATWDEATELASKRHYRRAVQKALNGSALYQTIGDQVRAARMLGKAAEVCQMAHHDRAAAYYLWKALRSLGKEDYLEKNWIWGGLARIYRQFWNFTRAEKYNRIHLKLAMEQNNALQTGYAHYGLALNHYHQEKWSPAMEHIKKALEVFSALEEPRLVFASRLGIACIHRGKEEYSEALIILEEILNLNDLPEDPGTICMAYEELGRVYLRTGDREKFLEARDKTAEWGSISKSLVEMGRVYLLDAEDCWLQGQRRKAIRNIRKAIVVFRNNGAVSPLHFAEQMLTSWLKGRGA